MTADKLPPKRYEPPTGQELWAEQTFEIVTVGNGAAIRCRLCDGVSALPGDVENKYCSRCHLFHDLVRKGRQLVAAGGTHDCGEWRTERDRCALCDRRLALES
jgi:hypothetical protein